jgi:hypothetical protein
MAGVIISGDTSGSVTLSAPAVAGTVTVTLPSTSGTMAVLPTATGVLAESAGGTGTTTGYYGFKNRIINGAMVISQRNGTSSVTPANNDYTLDRWQTSVSQSSKLTIQQNAGSVTPAVGYANYLGVTSSSAYSVAAGDYFMIQQKIEGFNTYDLAWGTANAKTVTLSFWVYSSLTGTFGGVATNSATDRSYPFTYTISSANTWEQKSVTIAGDTSGTWIGATNGVGIMLRFGLGVGSTYSGTAGAWAGATYLSATGATSVVGTNGATFYITGVQLEKGSTATSFDYRPYGTELALCQRYFYKVDGTDGLSSVGAGMSISTTEGRIAVQYPVKMRASPTASYSGTMYLLNTTGAGTTVTSLPSNYGGAQGAMISFGVASGLTVGAGNLLITNTGASNYFQASAEL